MREGKKVRSTFGLAVAVPLGCFIGFAVGDLLDHHIAMHGLAELGVALGAALGFWCMVRAAGRVVPDREDEG